MKYILTKEELDDLVPKKDKEKQRKALEHARKKILRISEFTCIYDGGYKCDGCPTITLKKEREDYENKIGNSHDLYELDELICTKTKNFSK
jgi:hypothetical protein